jgi:hypothetical protein
VFSPHGRVIEELSENDIVMNQLFVEDTETRHYLPNVLTHFRSEKWTFIRFKESNWWSMIPETHHYLPNVLTHFRSEK